MLIFDVTFGFLVHNESQHTGSFAGLTTWLWKGIKPAFSHVRLPEIGVDALHIRNGELAAKMVGEPISRRISNVDLSVRLSNNYHDMVLDMTGNSQGHFN